jgi:hypothetical protein
MKLYAGVTLEAFASCTSREQSSIKEEDIKLFSKFWVVNLDPLATGFIPLKMVPPMIRSVGSPFDILSVRLHTMRCLCIRQELILLSENSGKFVPKGIKGPLALLLRKLQSIEDSLWRPILEEHSGVGKDAAFSASLDQDEESSQGENEDQDEDTGEGQESPRDIEDKWQGRGTRQDPRLDGQDELHPFQISGNNFGRRQSTSAKRRLSKVRKNSSSKRMRKKSFIPLSAAKANSMIANYRLQSEIASYPGTPQATWKILLVQIPIWFLLKLLPRHEFLKRRPECVRFDEVLHALIYWNPTFRWVPRSLIASRSALDQEIITAVAKDMIGALCSGVAVRYRISKMLLLGETNLNYAPNQESTFVETGANNEDCNSTDEYSELFPAPWMDAANFWEREEEESTSRGTLARILIQNCVTLAELISIGSDQGLQLESLPNIFEDEQIPDVLCSDPRLAPACDQVRAKEIIRRLVKAGHEKLLKLYAEGLGFDVYSVTDLSELSLKELTSLLKLKPVQAKVLEVDGPLADVNEDIDKAIAESNDKRIELNNKLVKIKEERAQLLAVVSEARSRQLAAQTETDGLASALRQQGINIETQEVPDPLAADLLPGDVTGDSCSGSTDLGTASTSMLESTSVNDQSNAQTSAETFSSGVVDMAKLRDEIAVKRAQLKRLQEQLKVSKIREAAGSTVADHTEEEEAEMLACRQARLQRRMERRQQVSDLSNTASKSGLSAMGIEGPKKTRYNKIAAEETASKLPAWL